ncbi:RNA lariat debranching enzyme, putative [Plasmodium knowlesi strain H]|uniref:RNA lariat debranching enzyme, putative n=3 Tax=Plasmodium knowlesi TaxID=5850 RepID=A0A5K1VLR3_PLAKH|nr:RNA lariat debranching enzyme, putative [Plasmodium knowlesi strain H]OTN66132.1 putative RNA lariat debranching enzyme [Plasmodium knowlesi]CAA9989930.1 RNA lariat debranching enzyme, putative [Plasmodium knowlesi strain H]SBO24504.1 RNA lariat debranching enzyme, putative [Plasmodium knowlesi strain H]SBO26443.1 RNA lariat debranching enzyme, putative [Plasmodium knowlesi strain H]VVS79404.1 RNA lariat debranching enzyme, putative [Plasmodium knowlesi strain H]|eukprot:XP_002259946.1 RNA lariat debranching enzyme, putative [Plasmodium knowlesi strain H]
MIIAVVGCTHGELNFIYATIEKLEQDNNFKVDLLICCGDFECVRYGVDNDCLNVPNKYKKEENDFRDYFTGKKKAKVLTIFIGGNHEAVNVLKQLYYGGWVAPNIYFLGYSNIHNINDFRICSLSGIYKKYNFYKRYNEHYPYDEISKVSSYHIRKYEIEKLKLVKDKVDIVITHDWPNNIEKHGDMNELLRRKFHFQSDIYNNTLGNPHTEFLLNKLKPYFWFSSHLHVKYSAIFLHSDKKNYTRFLSLDKAEPRKHFIQILNIEKRNNIPYLSFDHLPKSSANETEGKSQFFNDDYEKLLQHVEDVQRKDAQEGGQASTGKEAPKGEDVPTEEEAPKENTPGESNAQENTAQGNTAQGNTAQGNTEQENTAQENTTVEEDATAERKQLYICYDEEWLAILKANHHLLAEGSDKDYNLEKLKYPSKEDFEYIQDKLKNLENISIKGKDYYLVHGYNNPSYKNLWEQRQVFLNRFDFEELRMYDDFERLFFAEEVRKMDTGLPLDNPKLAEDQENGQEGKPEEPGQNNQTDEHGERSPNGDNTPHSGNESNQNKLSIDS